ncbi:MAG: class II aldolase/adducin family protein [Firmicutes bacterium]|nr:class II aldolase/adducin family protein [Bacillota bacterium]
MLLASLREQVCAAAVRSYRSGLVRGTSGNWSARDPLTGLVAVTPSGLAYEKMTPEDIVVVNLDGEVVEGGRRPSSELPMHLVIYRRRPDVGGIAHTHSPYATALAVLERELPPVLIEMALVGTRVPVAPFAMPGTPEVGEAAVAALAEAQACLLARHGVVAVGRTVEEATLTAARVEEMAQIYHLAAQLGSPEPIPAEVMETLVRKYRGQ